MGEEEEDGEARGGGTSRAAAPPLSRRGEVEGTVKGDVSALGGLMGSYAKKRVRWADEEQAKDEDFMRTKSGFTWPKQRGLSRSSRWSTVQSGASAVHHLRCNTSLSLSS